MAMRSVLSLDVNLGLFGFSTKVYKGSDEAADSFGGFRQLHAACHHPINMKRVCAHCEGVEVAFSELVKGADVGGGTFVTVTDAELKALKPEGSGQIHIKGYLPATAIDASFYAGDLYLLAPGGKDSTAFVTWRDALDGRVALATVVMYGKERVVAIRAAGRLLSLSYLRTKAEVRHVEDVPGYHAVPAVASTEHKALMGQLMDRDTVAFADVTLDRDAYADAVKALIDSKHTGTPLAEIAEPTAAPVTDLAAMLKASLAAKKAA